MENLYKPKIKKKSFLSKCNGFIKDYFGLIPITGGIITTGAVYVISYAIGTINALGHESIALNGNPSDILYQLYGYGVNIGKYGERLAGEWAKAGFVGGQLLTYTLKKRLKSLIDSIFGKGEKNE